MSFYNGTVAETELIIRVRIVVEKDGDGYLATAPGLPGLIIDGDTVEEVEERIKDGIIVYLNMLAENKEPLPVGENLTVEIRCASNKSAFIDFNQFGSPVNYEPNDWKKTLWPTQKMLEIN